MLTPTQVLSCKYCEIFKNTHFYRTPPVAASDPNTTNCNRNACSLFKAKIRCHWTEGGGGGGGGASGKCFGRPIFIFLL